MTGLLETSLNEAPDPELARVALERVRAARTRERDEDLLHVVRLLGFSVAATDFLVRHPTELAGLDADHRDRAELDAELSRDVQGSGPVDGLRLFRRRAMLRVASRDLGGAQFEDVVREITAVAEACLEVAWRLAAGDLRLAVVGLGKLGGAELNYASDVDVIFVHEQGRGEEAGRSAARLIQLLSEPSAEGIALRVDTGLRPGGRGGTLSRSLEASLDYYERQSAVWERQALIKARPVAGDPWLGSQFVDGVIPFVYPRELPPETIEDVRRTKVRLEEYVRQRGKELTEVKRGRGGIRDVEFAVQLLQIVHGRREPRLRSPNTLAALAALAEEGYVAEADAETLSDAYRFLRTLEHRLQIVRDLQTHDLPSDERARTTLARSLGLADSDALQSEYDRQTDRVRTLHERLFYRPLLEAFAGPGGSPGRDRRATEELLSGLGFGSPERSFEVLARLVDPATRFGKVLAHVFRVMAPALALAANPDSALVRLERLAEAVGEATGPADVLVNDPRAARRLARVLASSSFATDLLVADPERIGALADGIAEDATGAFVSVVGRYAARELAPRDTGRSIAAVAGAVIRDAVETASPPFPFAAIGMGKLGAEELNFGSDLDLVFVYEGEGPGDLQTACAAAERILGMIRQAGWEPDPDLRPEGRSGPLARSLAGYLEYWERYADLWEFQSLLRARFVAGDRDLGRRFEFIAADFAYPTGGLTIEDVADMRRMRERVERERVRPPEASRFHFKLGHGSLADVQFAVELSLMRFGESRPQIRTRQTLEAIELLAVENLLEDRVARDLGEAFVFLSDVKNALEVDRRIPAEAVPPGPADQTSLARRLGYQTYPRQTFIDDYLRVTRRCRRAMDRVFREEA